MFIDKEWKKFTTEELIEMKRNSETDLKNIEIELTSRNQHLTAKEISRYSRQLILKETGKAGQLRLKGSKVLIVGCGGLGCPIAQYLSGAGIGHIGFVDDDKVDVSNLHRQIAFSSDTVGSYKSKCLANFVTKLNSEVHVDVYIERLNPTNALQIGEGYDILIDATDNITTRYLLNDLSVILDKPLVSGSALKWEGQMTVYNYRNGPTYRCLFPEPPPPKTVTSCSDGGVLGPVPGLIGVLQAIETIKILLIGEDEQNTQHTNLSVLSGRMLIFDATTLSFKCVKLRNRRPNVKINSIEEQDYNGMMICPDTAECWKRDLVKLEIKRISVQDAHEAKEMKTLFVDVRPKVEFEVVSFASQYNDLRCINIPWADIKEDDDIIDKILKPYVSKCVITCVVFVCMRGNDSRRTLIHYTKLRQSNTSSAEIEHPLNSVVICDMEGGLMAWNREIDSHFPVY